MRHLLIISVFAACFILSAFAQFDANCFGSRKALVHLFEWRWADIADECERYLSKNGYCGVQVSPPNEHRVIIGRPWWERYQPVSYKICTRSGDEAAFIDMVSRCNNVGVRVYVDVVLNHMVGEEAGFGSGTCGSAFNSKSLDFPGVPFDEDDFHKKGVDCHSTTGSIENYNDLMQVRNCRLLGLVDVNQRKEHVREKQVEYLNKLISFGVAGFRFDAAMHMWPDDLRTMFSNLSNLNAKWFQDGARPFIYQEVFDFGSGPIKASDYYGFGRVTEFNYGKYLSQLFQGGNQLKNMKAFGAGYGNLMPDKAALVFIDNHDNQRGHGAGGNILNFFNPRQYKMAVTFMLSWPYGQARVMSSYYFDRTSPSGDSAGPPSDKENIKPVIINENGTCENGWVCEHRWRAISNMAKFRNLAGDEAVANWWDDGDQQIAFSRGNRAFFAMNNGHRTMFGLFQTGMKPGLYCDVISGEKNGNACTGKTITVGSDGRASIQILSSSDEPMIAFHIDSKLDVEGPIPDPIDPTPETYKRTGIFLMYLGSADERLFLRGGISYARRPMCTLSPSQCDIPISYDHVKYTSAHYDAYNAWSQGDSYLDWGGAEKGQGTFNGTKAQGSPLVWTTNSQQDNAGYTSLNTYGQHFWMLDVNMDCDTTADGWFEFKTFLDGKWEADISQAKACAGTAGLSTPYPSENHIGKCGYKNVFVWGQNGCHIDNF